MKNKPGGSSKSRLSTFSSTSFCNTEEMLPASLQSTNSEVPYSSIGSIEFNSSFAISKAWMYEYNKLIPRDLLMKTYRKIHETFVQL